MTYLWSCLQPVSYDHNKDEYIQEMQEALNCNIRVKFEFAIKICSTGESQALQLIVLTVFDAVD